MRATGSQDFAELEARLDRAAAEAYAVFRALIEEPAARLGAPDRQEEAGLSRRLNFKIVQNERNTMSIEPGDKAPAFTLPTDGGGTVSLAKLKGKTVILYFYPKDDTPGCTKEACGFRDNFPKFAKSDAVVIGVSKDSVKRHDNFKAKYKLPFTLAADVDGKVCEAYGVWVEKSDLRPQIHGHRARDLPDRRQGRGAPGLAQGQGRGPRRRSSGGGQGALAVLVAKRPLTLPALRAGPFPLPGERVARVARRVRGETPMLIATAAYARDRR